VVVEGVVVETASFAGGFKLTLEDDTGQVVLLLWSSVYATCWDAPRLNLGAQVQAEGELSEYEGELQVQPAWGGAVDVLDPAAAWGEPRSIGSLSGADEGQRVMVEGQVIHTAGSEQWVKVSVLDESGEIGVFIWRNILDLIPNSTGLGLEGTRVRVVGLVEIYRSNLELVPTLPYDVTVLETPGQ
jgi:DNA/RNA endonuclease YhcR with UshA esterase domain